MRAKQEWDERIGATVVQAKNWRLAFFTSTLLGLALIVVVLIQLHQARVLPVLVGIDRERGEPFILGKISDASYQPQLQEIKFFLTHFITLVRSVPSDPVLIKQNWLKAYFYLRRDAANILNDITNKDPQSPLKKIGEQTVIIQPVSITQIGEGHSYQSRWEETVYNVHGAAVDHYVMTGIFTIELEIPKDEKAVIQNPLGLYIKHFQWNREL